MAMIGLGSADQQEPEKMKFFGGGYSAVFSSRNLAWLWL